MRSKTPLHQGIETLEPQLEESNNGVDQQKARPRLTSVQSAGAAHRSGNDMPEYQSFPS